MLSGHNDKDGVFYLEPPVLQLHGSVNNRDETPYLVCTRKGYRKILHQDESYTNFIRSLMSNYTILYIGFSFSDYYLNDLRASVLTMLGKTMEDENSIPLAYAITDNKKPGDITFHRRHEGVRFLNFNTKNKETVDNSNNYENQNDLEEAFGIFPPIQNEDPYHEFDDILEAIKEKTSPQILFAKLLASKNILWCDKNYKKRDFHAGTLRTLMSKLPKQYGKSNLIRKMSGSNIFNVTKDELSNYDLVITDYGDDGRNALKVLSLIMELRATELKDALKENDQDYVVHCPIILVHDDEYRSGVSESRKGQLVRLGAFDYTTDNESLTMAIVRALSVMEHGNNRCNPISIPGTDSSTKKRKLLDDRDNINVDTADRLLNAAEDNPSKRKKVDN